MTRIFIEAKHDKTSESVFIRTLLNYLAIDALAQMEIDAMWEKGEINEQTIEEWGNTKMRTPYNHTP